MRPNQTTPAAIAPENGAHAATGASAALTVYGLPLPPSLNNAYTTGRGHGRRVLTDEARQFKAQAGLLIRAAAAAQGFTVPPRRWLAVWLVFVFPKNNRDGDNACKLVMDAAAAALGFDDRYIATMTWQKLIGPERCDLTIEVLP